jgi:hypothetical protein
MIPIISSTFAGEAPDQPGSIKYIVSDSALQSVAQRSGTSVARAPGQAAQAQVLDRGPQSVVVELNQ